MVVEKLDFDDLLGHINGWGKFQIKLLILFIQFTFFLAYVGYSPILYLYTPDHWCNIPQEMQDNINFTNHTNEDLINLLIPFDTSTGKRSQCLIYDVRNLEEITQINASVPMIKCPSGWTYNITDYFTSATTQFDWVCEDKWKPAFTQSIFYAGAILGTLGFGWVSDHYGRYGSFISSNLVVMITGIATPFAFDFYSFVVLRFLAGLGFITFFISLYMLGK